MSALSFFRAAGLVTAGVLALASATLSGPASADQDDSASTQARPAETATTIRIGPFVLPPSTPDFPVVNQFRPNVPKPCENCYVTAIEPRLVNAAGERADMSTGVMLHHLLIAEPARDDVTCARTDGLGTMGRRLFASGDERTPIRLPDGFGFKIDPGPWIALMHLMNASETQQVVYFEALVRHVPASTLGMKPVTPVWLDMDNCRTSMYSVPPGKSSTTWSWTSTLTGRIVAAGGHVHAGGVGLMLDNATTRARICSSRAGYGSGAMEGMVTRMSTCSWDSLGALRAGDELVMTSMYDAHEAMDDVMGIMLIAVYETDDVNGGTTAPAWMRRTPQTHVPHGAGHDHGGGGGH